MLQMMMMMMRLTFIKSKHYVHSSRRPIKESMNQRTGRKEEVSGKRYAYYDPKGHRHKN
jgi:hypothetical protein